MEMRRRKNCYKSFSLRRTMNTLTSVVLLSLLVALSQAGFHTINATWWANITLVGPSDIPVTWYDSTGLQFCDGSTVKNPQIRHSCNDQNLTLIHVNKTHERTYMGYNRQSTHKEDYKVIVIPPRPVTVKPQSGPEYVNVNMGENKTLVGPPGIPVSWFNQDGLQFCIGDKVLHPEFNHTCDMQNLTLLFINLTHDGAYLGYNRQGTERTWYEVVVSDGFPKSEEMKVEEHSKETEQKQTGQKQSNHKQGGQKETSQKKTNDTQKPSRRRPSKLKPNTPDTKLITATSGSNVTLVGPAGKVTWYDDDLKRPCETGYKLDCKCDNQNLTLINVTKLYEGVYYGTNDKSDSKRYRIKVNTTNSQSVKIQPYTIPTTPENNHKFELQIDSNQDNDKIPSTTVAIVVGVIAGFVTLIIVFYATSAAASVPGHTITW
ncbi:50kDa protein [Human adenovirus 22]|uniref:50kDa protein n=1 Tax=Human adenovirus 22 TaxID=46924 RepID=D3GBY5_9ADEN|nr:50kDa protein [Human adenovirus 22]